MTAPYTTTDINLAAYLLYCGVEPIDIGVQSVGRSQNKAILHFDAEAAAPCVEGFYDRVDRMVELRKYNKARADIMRRINLTKSKHSG